MDEIKKVGDNIEYSNKNFLPKTENSMKQKIKTLPLEMPKFITGIILALLFRFLINFIVYIMSCELTIKFPLQERNEILRGKREI